MLPITKSIFALLIVLIGINLANAQGYNLGMEGKSSLTINPNSLIVANTFNNDSHSTLSCFNNSNDVADFYGESGGEQGHQWAVAKAFFAGSPPAGAQVCFVRIGIGGTRSRILGAPICSGASGATACENETNTNALAALQAVTNGSLDFVQNGVTMHITGINLSTANSLSTTAPAVQTLINTAITNYTTANTVQANFTGSVAPGAPCTGMAGTVGNGFVTFTAASGNCIYPGAQLSGVNGQGSILAQYSGTPNGLGTYAISSNQALSTLVPQVFSGQTMTYNVLTVGTGTTGTLSTGYRLSDSGTGCSPCLALSNVHALLSGGVTTQPFSCVASACDNTTWIISSTNPQTVTSEPMFTDLCTLGLTDTSYFGATVNTNKYWVEQTAECSSNAQNTLTYMTSDSAGATDNLAYLLGFSSSSPGQVPGPLSRPLISLYSETLGDPSDPLVPTYTAFLNNLYNNVQGAAYQNVLSFWWDPDDGEQTPTFKNELSTAMASSHSTHQYARVWAGDYAYPVASYSGNSPVGVAPCVAAKQTFTSTSASWTPDYCPVHDYVLIGAAGNGGTSTSGAAAVVGGAGASGAATYLTGLTTNTGYVAPASFQVGTAGSGTATALHTWALVSGADLSAGSGGNASGQTGGTSVAGNCPTLVAGTQAACVTKSGANGGTGSSTPGAGGVGGNSAGNAFVGTTHFGYTGGAPTTLTGGGGGGGTAAAGTVGATTVGGNGGLNLDGTAGAASVTANLVGTTIMTVTATGSGSLVVGEYVTGTDIPALDTIASFGSYTVLAGTGTVNLTTTASGTASGVTVTAATGGNAVQPGLPAGVGGAGGGTSTATLTGGAGASGHSDISLASLPNGCGGSNYGTGGGGGGGGGNKAATGAGVGAGGNGGAAGNYGASGGTGGSTTQTGGVGAGTTGASAPGILVICGYQDH